MEAVQQHHSNIIPMQSYHKCLGCGAATSGRYAYCGMPGTREYNRCANRVYRSRKNQRIAELENHVIQRENHVSPREIELEKRVAFLEQMLLQQRTPPTSADMPRKSNGKPDSLDDIEITVTAAKQDANNRSDWNFLIQSTKQITGSYDGLPPDVIRYGIAAGKIPPDAVKQPDAGNPKAMDVKQFDVPEIELDEDLL